MRIRKSAVMALTAVSMFSAVAQAATTQVASMDIQPCSKMVTDNGFPYVKWGRQVMSVTIEHTPLSSQYAQQVIQGCGSQAAFAAGASALLTNLATAAPVFWTTFDACVGVRLNDAKVLSLNTQTTCHY